MCKLHQIFQRWDSFSEEQITEICKFFPDHLITLVCSNKSLMSFSGYVIFADVSGRNNFIAIMLIKKL